MHTNIVHRLLWGGVLVLVGVVFLLNQMGFTSISIGEVFRTFWPVIIILVGVQGLLIQGAGGLFWNMIVLLVGLVFLGRNLNLIDWGVGDMFKLIGPAVLILLGISVIAKGSKSKPSRQDERNQSYEWNPVTPPMSDYPDPPPGPPPAPPLSDDPNAPFSDPTDAPPPRGGDDKAQNRDARPGARPEADTDERWHQHQGHTEDRWGKYQERTEKHWRRQQERMEEHWRRHQERHKRKHACDSNQWWGYDPDAADYSRFIGDVHIGQDYWELRPMSISHFIGDTTIDLTKAQIPLGETKIYVSCFIGDVKVFIPSDANVGIQVVSSSLIGDVRVWDQKRGGLFNSVLVEIPYYADTDKRIVLVTSSFIGDVRVTKVG